MNLTLEQEFSLIEFKQNVSKLTETESKELLVKMLKELIEMENNYKELIKHNWGL